MDREIAKAVQNGKLYSLAFKAGNVGTPGWLFDSVQLPPPTPARVSQPTTGARRIELRDHGGDGEDDESDANSGNACGVLMHLGSPADEIYREQTDLLANPSTGKLPDKDLSYMLMHAGFPLINEGGEYLGQPQPLKQELPGPTEQTGHRVAVPGTSRRLIYRCAGSLIPPTRRDSVTIFYTP